MSSRNTLVTFLTRYFPGHALEDDEDIFALGFVNSLFAMKLVGFIESAFEIQIEQADLDIDNFRTVNAMVAFVAGKQAAGGAAARA